MQYEMDFSCTMAEHLGITSGIIHDLKAANKEISEGEQVLNVIRALPEEECQGGHDAFISHKDY